MSCFPPQETRQNSAASIATSSRYSALSRKGCRESPLPAPAHYRRNVWATRYSGTSRHGGRSGRLQLPTPATAKVGWGRLLAWALLPPLNQTLPGLSSRKREVHLDLRFHRHRLAIQHVWIVPPLLHGFNRCR